MKLRSIWTISCRNPLDLKPMLRIYLVCTDLQDYLHVPHKSLSKPQALMQPDTCEIYPYYPALPVQTLPWQLIKLLLTSKLEKSQRKTNGKSRIASKLRIILNLGKVQTEQAAWISQLGSGCFRQRDKKTRCRTVPALHFLSALEATKMKSALPS